MHVHREAILLSLLSRTFTTKTIVFFDTKIGAHRCMIVLGLAGIRVAELHGNLTMTQRLEALERFKSGDVEVLVATDLAARGLDITVSLNS
jgi:ATP-dependent RNA helicase DDX27